MRREEHKSYEQAPCYPPRQARWRTSSLTFCLRCLSQEHSKPPQDIAFVRTIRISFPEGNFSARPWREREPWWVGRGYRELPCHPRRCEVRRLNEDPFRFHLVFPPASDH